MNRKTLLGFTLVEMTVVLVIIGLLLTGLLVPLREGIKQERRQETEENLKTIEEALYGFVIANGRLPCPDCRNNNGGCISAAGINDGIEDFGPIETPVDNLSNNTCLATATGSPLLSEGNVPWATLSTPQFDAWQSWYTYSVSRAAADFVGNATAGTAGENCTVFGENITTIDICAVGDIQILNMAFNNTIYGIAPVGPALCPAPAPLPATQPAVLGQNAFAVVVSHGENVVRNPLGAGLINAPNFCNEIENTNQDSVFISSGYINPGLPGAAVGAGGTSVFGIDDQLIWISPQILKSRLVQAGRLP